MESVDSSTEFRPGNVVRARSREWVVLPETRENLLKLRPLGGSEDDATVIYLPLEPELPVSACFEPPDPEQHGSLQSALLLSDALRLKLRSGAGPFRSFGNLNVEPRAYQLVPLLMALKQATVRLLVADDVGIGKTIEACLIARELLDRGEIERLTVICPPHLCEQWQLELAEKFSIDAEIVRTGTATRLERELQPDESIFEVYPFTVVSLDYIKSDRRRSDFLRACPEFVIVDEAHTCVQSSANIRHQRYQLLKGLSESEPRRGMVLLTATPHSGDDTAFHNLLGLLDPRFSELAEITDDDRRQHLRDQLRLHFVQRRRGDIEEWKDDSSFPVRESREATYRLTGDWGSLFDDILAYARTMVRRAERGTRLEQRMSWWAALALLRCASSSPAAASLALRTRLQGAEGESEDERLSSLDLEVSETVMDEAVDGSLTLSESVPAGTLEEHEDTDALHNLIARADGLRGPKNDPKLDLVVSEVRKLIGSGFRPVVFCRYISTAHYVGAELKQCLSAKKTEIEVVTGEFSPDQRKERVDALAELEKNVTPVLVATDCLSEGVNLQSLFNAVVHYDLTWNPTRHEQREGRADRFGQASKTVRALMLYGENNPVDGAVLRVILRKAEKIRKELGVSVPLPADNNKVVDAIMEAVLLHEGPHSYATQTEFDFSGTETSVDDAWRKATNRMTRTVFAQRRLSPDDVLPEWRKSVSVLGGPDDVQRFVRLSADQLKAPLEERDGYSRLPLPHLPKPVQDRLNAIGFNNSLNISFSQPAPAGAIYLHRAHPLVASLADFIVERALTASEPDIAARSGAVFTDGVDMRTVLYILRLRYQVLIDQRRIDGRFSKLKSVLAEECLGVAVKGGDLSEPLIGDDALSLLSLEASRNMPNDQKAYLIREALRSLPEMEELFERVVDGRANQLLSDHRRIREASDAKGLRYDVVPALPVDKIGIFVFVPMNRL